MSATLPLNNDRNPMFGNQKAETPIGWQYFYGGQSSSGKGKKTYERYHFAIVNGVRVEKYWRNPNHTSYSIGNHDHAKKKFKTEKQLIEALKSNK